MTNRRVFLMAGGGVALAQSPSKQISAALIGSGGEGRALLQRFRREPGVSIAGVCDVYEPNLEAGLSVAGPGAKAWRNYKAVLDTKDIDVVIIATPEHWHHRMLLDALAAGKDVYIEKPLCHTLQEGVEMLDAAKASRSVIQVGMQRRSSSLFLEGREIRRAGKLGAVRMVRTFWLNNDLQPMSRQLEGPLDWEQWQGPAPRVPKDPRRFFDWRNYSAYSSGVVMDQGAHIFDSIHMIMDAGAPISVSASSCRGHKPGVDMPETWVVVAEYAEDFLAVFTINYSAMRYPMPEDQLNCYDGDTARMDLGRDFLRVYESVSTNKPLIHKTGMNTGEAVTEHIRDFLKCVRTRETPRATVEIGFQAALVLLLANLSAKQGKRLRWNGQQRRVEI
ncbi:MAG TPA: Gfo/Idh/MocA family oxidoreductase [Bryobacteraceae bacterium]|nr:Gfo/Idh/MocA family oxidoreductase [Bryobacteraceae bacterium]